MEPLNVNLASETLTGKRHAPAPAPKAGPSADETTRAGGDQGFAGWERVTLRTLMYIIGVYSFSYFTANESAAGATVFAVMLAGLACSARR